MTGLLLSTCEIQLDNNQRACLRNCEAAKQASGLSCPERHVETTARTSESVSCASRMPMPIAGAWVSKPLSEDPWRVTCAGLQRDATLGGCVDDLQPENGRANAPGHTAEQGHICRLCRVIADGRQDAHEGVEQRRRGHMAGVGDDAATAGKAMTGFTSYWQPQCLWQKHGSSWSAMREAVTSLWPGHSMGFENRTNACWASLVGAPGDPCGLLPRPETRRQIGVRWPQNPCFVHVVQRRA